MSAANIAATLGDTARDAAARWLAEAAARPATTPHGSARRPPGSATQVASPRRLTAWTTLPSSVVRGHRGARFLGQRASLNNGNGARVWATGAV
jgi:hypothetical protein